MRVAALAAFSLSVFLVLMYVSSGADDVVPSVPSPPKASFHSTYARGTKSDSVPVVVIRNGTHVAIEAIDTTSAVRVATAAPLVYECRGLGLTMTRSLVILSVPKRSRFMKGDRILHLILERDWIEVFGFSALENTLRSARDRNLKGVGASVKRSTSTSTSTHATVEVVYAALLPFTDPPPVPSGWANLGRLRVLGPATGPRRKVYFDLGARTFAGGSFDWFRSHYPHFQSFHSFYLFEILDVRGSYRELKWLQNFHLMHCAAWTHDRGVSIKGMRMGRVAEGPDMKRRQSDTRQEWHSPSVDFAKFLLKQTVPDDFVVVKIDVEGGEWALLEHMALTGALRRVDELFVECHSRTTVVGADDPLPQDCVDLINGLRSVGVFAHGWY